MTAVETTTCPGSGRSPLRMRRGHRTRLPARGLCPVCECAVELVTHPDGGPGGVVDDHTALGEEKASA